VTQLAQDPDLWNRWWAIGELSRRADDTLAARALTAAATGADYFLTREHAATALARFPAAVAFAALDSARRDTSAQVREAAVTSLGNLRIPEALAAVRATMSDSSYAVQAAAIGVLIRQDSANRASWVARGLGAHSYRDAIRNSTLDAIARLGDRSYTASVDSLRGESPRAAFTLAVLSARGDSAALGDLVRALDDPRPYVRDWTLRAVSRLPAELRDPPLRAVASSLHDEKTRAEVDALLNPRALPGTH
jgi:HEAT repeat protein